VTHAWPQPDRPATFSRSLASLGLWLIIQLAALLLPMTQLRLADQYPRPPERLALAQMLTIQIVFSAMLFPLLMPSRQATVLVILSTLPMIQLAGMLAAQPPATILAGAAYVSIWLACLGLGSAALRYRKARLWAVAVATSLALIGPLLAYLRLEFAASSTPSHFPPRLLAGPVMGVLRLLQAPACPATWTALASLATVVLVVKHMAGRHR